MVTRRTGGLVLALGCSLVILLLALLARSDRAVGDLRNGRAFIQDNLWSTDDHQFAVWTAPDGEPLVGRRDRRGGDWTVRSLASAPDNPLAAPTEDDLHNVYVIGVDHDGFVHVAGNMHADELRYARSTRPHDISEWEVATVTGPSDRVTYPMFVSLPDGTLLFVRREGDPGRGDILLDALPPGSRRWEHRGVIVSGSRSGEGPYLHRIAVDPMTGMMHVFVVWRGSIDPSTNSDVSYARSPDGGLTWERSDGSRIAGPVSHVAAELVIDTADRRSGLVNNGGLALDARGRPHAIVAFGPSGTDRELVHVWHDGASWRREDVAGWEGSSRPAVFGRPDGSVWMVGSVDSELTVMQVHPTSGPARKIASAPRGWEPTVDSQALARSGRAEVLVPEGTEPRVHVASDQPGSR